MARFDDLGDLPPPLQAQGASRRILKCGHQVDELDGMLIQGPGQIRGDDAVVIGGDADITRLICAESGYGAQIARRFNGDEIAGRDQDFAQGYPARSGSH